MNRPNPDLDGTIDLSAVPPFRLGLLEITPSTREVRHGGSATLAEPRALQVLCALHQAQGSVVSRDELVRRCWDGRIVGEDAINRSIAKTRALAELADPPAFVIETIPRVGYRLKTVAAEAEAGFPRIEAAPPPGASVQRRLVLIGSAAAAVAATGGVAWFVRRPRVGPGEPSVAVLPFDNLSQDPQLGYFADGLSEDILNALVKGGGVSVTAPSSSFIFRGAGKAKAGPSLNVAYLLDGSVLRDGDRLRVNAHLSDVKRAKIVWSDTYDRQVAQGLQLEDEIAGQVASAMKLRLLRPLAVHGLIDPAVYELYLKGRDGNRVHSIETLAAAKAALDEAARRDENFAPIWFELAKNAWRRSFFEDLEAQMVSSAEGQAAARRALALDPNDGAAYGVLSVLSPAYNRFQALEDLGDKALSLAPNDPNVILWRVWVLFNTGRLGAAARAAARASELDPLELFSATTLATILTFADRFGEAQKAAGRVKAIWPNTLAAYWNQFWLMVTQERFTEAADYVLRLEGRPLDGANEFPTLAQALRAIASDDPAQKRAAVHANLALAGKGTGYASYACILLARLGDEATALDVIRSLYLKQGPVRIDRTHQFLGANRYQKFDEAEPAYLFHPFLAGLRRSGRLNFVFDAIGLTAFWKTNPPDF